MTGYIIRLTQHICMVFDSEARIHIWMLLLRSKTSKASIYPVSTHIIFLYWDIQFSSEWSIIIFPVKPKPCQEAAKVGCPTWEGELGAKQDNRQQPRRLQVPLQGKERRSVMATMYSLEAKLPGNFSMRPVQRQSENSAHGSGSKHTVFQVPFFFLALCEPSQLWHLLDFSFWKCHTEDIN